MSYFLRPDGNITSTNIIAGDYTDIDETTANDSDFVQTNSLSTSAGATFECSLSNPSATPKPGTTTVRWRASTPSGAVTIFVTVSLVEGTTVLDTDSQIISTTATTREWEPDTSGVTDWDDLRLRWDFDILSGSAWAYLYWAELEAPSVGTFNETITEALTSVDGFAAAATINATVSESITGADSYAPAATINAAVSESLTAADIYNQIFNETLTETLTASDSFLGGTDYYQTISESITASDTYGATVTEPNGWIIPAPPVDGWVESGAAGGAWTEISDTDTDWTEI